MKERIWLGSARRRVQEFPEEARRQAGYELWLVQLGDNPLDWRPMQSIGPGAIEIRLHKPHEHRVIYVARYAEGVYVLNAFEKKTQGTPQREIGTARKNYAEMEKKHAQIQGQQG